MADLKFSQMLGNDTDPVPLMQRIASEALTLVGAAQGAAVLLAHGESLAFVSASGVWAGRVGSFVARAGTVVGRAIDGGQVMHCDDMPRNPGGNSELWAATPARSLVCVPLYRDETAIGALAVVSQEPSAFSSGSVRVLSEVAQFVAVALGSVLDMTAAMGEVADAVARGGSHRAGDAAAARAFMRKILTPGVLSGLTGRERMEQVIAGDRLQIVTQPIVDLERGRLVGVEALSRFPEPPTQSPDVWFREAHEVGLGVELQVLAIARALELLDVLPPRTLLGVNAGPDALTSPALLDMLMDVPPERVVLELTEHLPLEDYAEVGDTIDELRQRGFRLAIDDVGAGFSSFRHVLSLKPDMIKLDRCFTTDIDRDPTRRAMAESLVRFARTTGTEVFAEGIETERELEAIRTLGIRYGQGYLLARPAATSALPDHYDVITGAVASPAAQA